MGETIAGKRRSKASLLVEGGGTRRTRVKSCKTTFDPRDGGSRIKNPNKTKELNRTKTKNHASRQTDWRKVPQKRE